MKQTFKLKKGEILFEQGKIIITDDAKKTKWMMALLISLGSINGFLTFWRYFKTGDQFDFWFGLTIGCLGIVLLIIWLFRSYRSEISMDEVKSLKLKQRFRNKFLDIKLNSNRLRRVSRVDNAEEIAEFIGANFRSKLN